jgi:hypothetical protein
MALEPGLSNMQWSMMLSLMDDSYNLSHELLKLKFSLLDLHRDPEFDNKFIQFLNTGEEPLSGKFTHSYYYYVQNPTMFEFDAANDLIYKSDGAVVNNLPIFLVKLVSWDSNKAVFKRIKLILNDDQGWTQDVELDAFKSSSLYYGLFWFILKVPLPDKIQELVLKYCKDSINEP